MKTLENTDFENVLYQRGVMLLPEEISEEDIPKRIKGKCSLGKCADYINNAGAIAFYIEAAGQYAEILIRHSEIAALGKLLLVQVKDLNLISTDISSDIVIKVELKNKVRNIFKSFFEIYIKDELTASGYLLHMTE